MVNAIMGQFFMNDFSLVKQVIMTLCSIPILKIYTDVKNMAYTFARSINNLY